MNLASDLRKNSDVVGALVPHRGKFFQEIDNFLLAVYNYGTQEWVLFNYNP